MRHKCVLVFFFLFMLVCVAVPLQAKEPSSKDAEEIIEKVKTNFMKIKDATAKVDLDYNLHLFGCAGAKHLYGHGHFKAPDRLEGVIDGDTYFVRGNDIRKIRKDGQKFYVRLLNSLDFSIGLHPGLITHNFYLKIIKKDKKEIVIEGIPKPGVLKNAKKVIFYLDPQRYLLRELNIVFPNPFLGGRIKIDYEKIKGIWVPTACSGNSAVELKNSILVGYGFNLRGKSIKINTGLSDDIFKPGF